MRCLFCKEESSSTKGVEHVIPESIGSKKHVLPKGLVCDKCNNYFARKVEAPVLSHESIRNVRAWYQVPNKKGKMPTVKGYIAGTDIKVNMKKAQNGKIVISAEKSKEQAKVDRYLASMGLGEEFPPFLFPISIDPPQKEMSRFLAMMGLEAIALRFSYGGMHEKIIDEEHFDLIRSFARYGQGVDHWPYHSRTIFPMDTEMLHPETGEWVQAGFGHDLLVTRLPETYFVFLLYGVEFAINLGGPSIKGFENWLVENNNISPFVERGGSKLVKVKVNGVEKHRLIGTFDMRDTADFDQKKYYAARENA